MRAPKKRLHLTSRHATEEVLNPLEQLLKLLLMIVHDWKRNYWHWELAVD